jgi:hypothetical protein
VVRGGNVATGAREMLDALGVEWVQPEELGSLKAGSAPVSLVCNKPPRVPLTSDLRMYATRIVIHGSPG